MKTFLLLCVLVLLALVPVGWAASSTDDDEYLYTPEELEELLAPVALYPDPLLAQLLPASSFGDQIHEAADLVRKQGRNAPIDRQPWDVSVKAIAHYPELILMLDEKPDWTQALGEAFANQQAEVMNAIQSLRADARAAGNLVSSSRMQVVEEGGYIRLLPPEPERIYIPTYDPVTVYYSDPAYYSSAVIGFGIGFPIGVWLNRDCDWFGHRIYYHGWRGGGWIRRSRPHVNIRNNIYVNNRHRTIYIERRRIRDGRGAAVVAPLQRRRLPGRQQPGISVGGGDSNRHYRIRPDRNREYQGSGRERAIGSEGVSPMRRRGNPGAVIAPRSSADAVPGLPTKSLPHQVPLPEQNRLPRQEPLPEQVPITPPAAREPQLPAPPRVGPPPVVAPAPGGGGFERRR